MRHFMRTTFLMMMSLCLLGVELHAVRTKKRRKTNEARETPVQKEEAKPSQEKEEEADLYQCGVTAEQTTVFRNVSTCLPVRKGHSERTKNRRKTNAANRRKTNEATEALVQKEEAEPSQEKEEESDLYQCGVTDEQTTVFTNVIACLATRKSYSDNELELYHKAQKVLAKNESKPDKTWLKSKLESRREQAERILEEYAYTDPDE